MAKTKDVQVTDDRGGGGGEEDFNDWDEVLIMCL